MKVEVGESLIYSWLRHIKKCQIVQNNWKSSSMWEPQHNEELEILMKDSQDYFNNKSYDIYKKTKNIDQLIKQTECDALGILIVDNKNKLIVVDVAFHEAGLEYGTKHETAEKVISKMIKSAMMLYSFFDSIEGDIVFVSPKVGKKLTAELKEEIDLLQDFMNNRGFNYSFRLLLNEQFNEEIVKPVCDISNKVADTSELFLRSYQLLKLFN
ncbi:MAG: hypothetical protein MJ172_11490 [Clostridia bacterium]|nr:hypothetical protein [Clostridia bacterium]